MTAYVAVDIGASSGRLILSKKEDKGILSFEEVYRFKNGFSKIDETDYWDIHHLVKEILTGLEKVKKLGITNCYVGIDTWAVDYCLMDKHGNLLGQPVSYRDGRTEQVLDEFETTFPLTELYQRTGIQLQPFNTIFQLYKEERKKLIKANQLLLIPDYLGYCLTGKKAFEKTNASTTQLLHLKKRKLDFDLIDQIHVQKELFPDLVEPGTILGKLISDKFPTYDLPDATVITVASHDTASAVVGTPGKESENWAYISSGTWSLIGVERSEGITSDEAYRENFTNEWGVNGTIRFLKNVMGMWLIQEVARIQNYQYTYPELAELAKKEVPFVSLIDVNDSRFLNPANMIDEIKAFCLETNQVVPQTPGEIARCIYDSLSLCYATELKKIEKITKKSIDVLHIVGGGSNNDLLNQLTANACGIPILSGPSEATAIGNVIVQMIATQKFKNLDEAREGIKQAIPLKKYLPQKEVTEALQTYENLTSKERI